MKERQVVARIPGMIAKKDTIPDNLDCFTLDSELKLSVICQGCVFVPLRRLVATLRQRAAETAEHSR